MAIVSRAFFGQGSKPGEPSGFKATVPGAAQPANSENAISIHHFEFIETWGALRFAPGGWECHRLQQALRGPGGPAAPLSRVPGPDGRFRRRFQKSPCP